MAQMLPIKMSKFDNQPWGFRIQGGIDFAAPLTVQKVNGGSLAEKAGLCVGDNLIRVNNTDIYQMRHKDAQDSISKAGNNFELVVSRGGLKPKVISAPLPLPTTAVPAAAVSNGDAVQQSEGSRLVNKQFNSPMGLYSEENIAETLSSQAEVLAQGVLGVNFKKNEKTYDPANSEVFKMVQEMARLPKEAEPESQQQRTVLSPLPNKSSFPGFPTAGIVPPAGGVRCFPAAPEPSPTLTGIRQSPMTGAPKALFQPRHAPVGFSPVAAPAAAAPVAAPFSAPVAAPVAAPFSAPVAAPFTAPVIAAPVAPPKGAGAGTQSAPRRGMGILKTVPIGGRVPMCTSCNAQIRGKFVTALGLTWCPNHFVCAMKECQRPLTDVGFVEEKKSLYCETCFENFLAPACARCQKRVKGDCLNAIGKQFHPECFACTYCGRLFGNSHFYLEDGLPYCETDWNELFTTKCFACGYPIEAGDRWVEAMNNNYHSQCFTCAVCKKNLEGQSFLGKGGRPICKSHAPHAPR